MQMTFLNEHTASNDELAERPELRDRIEELLKIHEKLEDEFYTLSKKCSEVRHKIILGKRRMYGEGSEQDSPGISDKAYIKRFLSV